MKLVLPASALLSVLLGACGEGRPPLLQDAAEDPLDDTNNPGTGGTGGTGGTDRTIPISETSGSGGGAGSMATGGSGSGSGGMGGEITPVEPCSLGTWQGEYVAHSQAELGGISGYTHVAGGFYIGVDSRMTGTDVSSLEALDCLEVVDGHFQVLENPLLEDLTGLEALTQVGRLTFSTNAGLETLEGPVALEVLGVLNITRNASLTALSDGIVSATDVYISSNPQLPQCLANAFSAALGKSCESCTGNSGEGCPP